MHEMSNCLVEAAIAARDVGIADDVGPARAAVDGAGAAQGAGRNARVGVREALPGRRSGST